MLEQAIKKILSQGKPISAVKLIGMVYATHYGVGAFDTFDSILRKISEKKLPSFETISRTRRKILNENKRL